MRSFVPLGLVALTMLVLVSPANAAGEVYAADQGGRFVAQFSAGSGGALTPLSPPTAPAGQNPQSVVVAPGGGSAYVVNQGPFPSPGSVSVYTVGAGGALIPSGSAVAGVFAEAAAVTPDGRHLYVANGDSTVSQYAVDPTSGALSPLSPASVPSAGFAAAEAISPDGRFLYVTDLHGQLSRFAIDPSSGALASTGPPLALTERQLQGIALSPDGRSAYVVDGNHDRVLQFDVDATSGALRPKAPPAVATGSLPVDVALTPDGRSAYVTNGTFDARPSDTISQYDVATASGALTPKTPATVPTGTGPVAVAVAADGRSAYVAAISAPSNGLFQYAIDPSRGTLSPLSPPAVVAGQQPRDVAVRPAVVGPSTPTRRSQCRRGGWRSFPGFDSRRQCVAFVNRMARAACRSERKRIGRAAFRSKYGVGRPPRHALRRCVRRTGR